MLSYIPEHIQKAAFEQFGVEGLKAFQKTVDYCHEKDLVVFGDVKRGDIRSISEAYATGHLGKVSIAGQEFATYDEDFATVNPYLGTDGIKPFVDVCKKEKKGIFTLVKTSNLSSGEFQDRLIDGRPLYEWVGEKIAEWGSDCMGDSYSYVGAVVGATYPEQGRILRRIMPKSFILVPGYGAQGGKGSDLVDFFNEDGLGAIVNSSCGIIAAYKQTKYKEMNIKSYDQEKYYQYRYCFYFVWYFADFKLCWQSCKCTFFESCCNLHSLYACPYRSCFTHGNSVCKVSFEDVP